jgi:hypothetical protein
MSDVTMYEFKKPMLTVDWHDRLMIRGERYIQPKEERHYLNLGPLGNLPLLNNRAAPRPATIPPKCPAESVVE